MNLMTRVQILNNAVCDSISANAFGKGILSPTSRYGGYSKADLAL